MDTTDIQAQRWVERRWAARLVRLAVYAVPLAMSVLASLVLSSLLPIPESVTWAVLRWVLIVAVSTSVLVATERVSRRLLPLAALLKLSLAFPDRVPSRFAIAIRIGTTSQLRQRIEAARRGEISDAPGAAAEQLIELVGLLSHHDRLTRGHSERVRAYTHLVGVEMGITGDELERLRWAALLHDVGKIMVPGTILNKAGGLTAEELATVRTHPVEGQQLVEPLAEWLGESVRAVWEHHERFDGSGYPNGLAGSEISLAARIVSVTDAFDVMTSARSYQQPISASAARAELSACAGAHFDPTVVRAFLAASIGTTHTATKPLALLAQLFLFPRAVLANATATLGAAAVLAAGTVVGTLAGTVAHPVVAVPATSRPTTTLDRAEAVADASMPVGGANAADQRNGWSSSSESEFDGDVGSVSVAQGNDGGTPSGVTVSGRDEPDVTVPNGTVPGTTLPTSSVPPTTLPVVPDLIAPDTAGPGLTSPVIDVDVDVDIGTELDVDLDVGLGVDVVTVPVIGLPEVTVPVVTLPVVSVPSLSIPLVPVTLPEVVVSVPPISVPPISVPAISVPPISVPPISVPVVSLPPINLPPLDLTGGLFGRRP